MTEQALPPADHRDEATRRFLAELSHDLRTPPSAIIGLAEAKGERAFCGTVDIESAPGAGTAMRLRLPFLISNRR